MGFLSKLMKNPMVQMALPFALSAAMPGIGGAFASAFPKASGVFGAMNPMAANALKQSMLGYGTAALTGAKKPGKAALYSGLASIPFSYMSAANAANQFNKDYAGLQGQALKEGTGMYDFQKVPGTTRDFISGVGPQGTYKTPIMPGRGGMGNYGPRSDIIKKYIKPEYIDVGSPVAKVSPMDILMGDVRERTIPSMVSDGKLLPASTEALDANIFTKMVSDPNTGEMVSRIDPIGTLGPLGAGLLGEYVETQEERNAEEWARNKERRRKELAFMYGVDPSMIEGEMDNPFYTGAFMNSGGIASLNMDMGGGVSGPGGPKDDMIDAKLSDGEFVMTAKAVENFGNGDRYQGARKMYDMMNMLDPESETMQEVV
jgi:hypothetical protein